MRGHVLWWDPDYGRGVIEGEDSVRYTTYHRDLVGVIALYPGQIVDFSPKDTPAGLARHQQYAKKVVLAP